MFRLEGASRAIRRASPEFVVDAAAVVTALGGVTFLLFGLSVLYWVHHRRTETATVVGYGFVGYALVLALKGLLRIDRPPEDVWAIHASGWGFPSGHAAAAMLVYGGLALEYDRLRDPRVAVPAGLLVLAIALSRVVLGVHYLGDVLVGLALGAALLAGLHAVASGRPSVAFAIGAVLALPTIAITENAARLSAYGILGACVAGAVAAPDRIPAPESLSRVARVGVVVVGLAFVVAVQTLEGALEDLLAAATALDDAVLVAGVLLLPLAADRVEQRVEGQD